ncbi:MFS transporter [Pseudonocardia halophobica]|uniref:MFS transporter n=1 Tax=Pseudonocardia halophobica TaxID=29401 RepID=A0A9W6L1N5_9PSEU|nr:MFS transporter [Pseudonocardia halophobica]GLL10594.1 MFS transporter [Pseudonocardia halophobica]
MLTTVGAVVGSLGTPLIPSIATLFDVPLTAAQWSLTAPLLTSTVSTPILGRIGAGRFRRRTLLAGLGTVVTGLVLSLCAPAFSLFVTGRAMQGLGLALIPLAMAVARDEMAPERRTSTIALLSVTGIAGAGLGFPLSSAMAELGGLRAAYGLGLALVAGTTVLTLWFVPRSSVDRAARVDWTGGAMLSVGLVAVLLPLTQGAHWGWSSPWTWGLGSGGVVMLAVWVLWSRATSHPLIDLSLAARPGLAGPNSVSLFAGVGTYALMTMSIVAVGTGPDADGFGLGLPTVVNGLVLIPYSVLSVLGSRAARLASARWGTRMLLPTGCGFSLIATVGLAVFPHGLWQVLLWMALGGLGSGFTFASIPVLMVPHVPGTETGSALAFSMVLRSLGMTAGSALGVALMVILGGGAEGFRTSLLIVSSAWVVGALCALTFSGRVRAHAPSDALVLRPDPPA